VAAVIGAKVAEVEVEEEEEVVVVAADKVARRV
jgi:hypothetical protein